MNPTLPRQYSVFEQGTSDSNLRLQFLQFLQFTRVPRTTVSVVSVQKRTSCRQAARSNRSILGLAICKPDPSLRKPELFCPCAYICSKHECGFVIIRATAFSSVNTPANAPRRHQSWITFCSVFVTRSTNCKFHRLASCLLFYDYMRRGTNGSQSSCARMMRE